MLRKVDGLDDTNDMIGEILRKRNDSKPNLTLLEVFLIYT